jgi:hypothetical protein
MTDAHYPYLPRRSASELLLNELRSLNSEVQNLRFAVQNFSLSGEMHSLCEAVQGLQHLGLIEDEDSDRYLPPRRASNALIDKLSSLRDEVESLRDGVREASPSGPLIFIAIAIVVQAFFLCVMAYDIHVTLHPNLS